MTGAHPAHSTGGASRDAEGATAVLGLAEWLCLAATPTFAIRALLTGLGGARGQTLFVRARGAAGRNGHHVSEGSFQSPRAQSRGIRRNLRIPSFRASRFRFYV
jgi:hypothetical protein